MIKAALFFWQFPQNIAALAVILILGAKRDDRGVWVVKKRIGVSLGNFIILGEGYGEVSLRHEKGHQRQSLMLGFFYLPVAGFTSAVCNNLWDRIFHRSWPGAKRAAWYYSRFPEAWADRLGGVSGRFD